MQINMITKKIYKIIIILILSLNLNIFSAEHKSSAIKHFTKSSKMNSQLKKIRIKKLSEAKEQIGNILKLFAKLNEIITKYFNIDYILNIDIINKKLQNFSDNKSKESLLNEIFNQLTKNTFTQLSIQRLDQNQIENLSNILKKIKKQLCLLKTIIELDNLEFD